MEVLAEIVKIITEIFTANFMNFVVVEASRNMGLGLKEKLGGVVQVSLLKKVIDVMESPTDQFTVGKKVYKRDPQFEKHQRIFNVYTEGEGDKMKVFILHSATDKYNMKDIAADAGLALNFKTQRVKRPVKLQLQAENKYLKTTKNIMTIGYSLGSFVAEESSKKGAKSREIVIISRPITFLNVRSLLPRNVFSLKNKLDPVGILSLLIKSGSKETILNPKVRSIRDFFNQHYARGVLDKLEKSGVTEVGLKEENEEIKEIKEEKAGAALPIIKKKNMKVGDLKAEIKRLRKEKKQSVKTYNVARRTKGELIAMHRELLEL